MAPVPPPNLVRPAAPKGWLATFVILLIMLFIPIGGCVAAGSVAGLPDKPIDAGHGVIVFVPKDWQYGGRIGDDRTVVLSRGNANVGITVKEGTDEQAALAALRTDWLATGTVAAGEIVPVTDVRTDGKPAARFPYSGTFPSDGPASAVEGEATGVRGNGMAVVFDAWASKGQFQFASGDVAQIISRTTIP